MATTLQSVEMAMHQERTVGIDRRSSLPRWLDFLLASLGLLACLPIFLVVGVWITLDSAGPIFFHQERIGQDGVSFEILKFRTMFIRAEDAGRLTVGDADPRITRAGAFLRRYKIDELPQLWNVLCGDMKFVGPRPEVPEYVHLYNEVQRFVLSVPPGITDPASLHFRDENSMLANSEDPERTYVEEILPLKLDMNVDYLMSRTIRSDLGLIGETVRKAVLKVG